MSDGTRDADYAGRRRYAGSCSCRMRSVGPGGSGLGGSELMMVGRVGAGIVIGDDSLVGV